MLEVGGESDGSTLDELNRALRDAVAQRPNEEVVDLAEALFVDWLALHRPRRPSRCPRAAAASGHPSPRASSAPTDQFFAAHDYLCRVSLDSEPVAEKTFTVRS